MVFEWADGECLFDHWNFETYQRDIGIKSPKEKFKELPVSKKLKAIEVLNSFFAKCKPKGICCCRFL